MVRNSQNKSTTAMTAASATVFVLQNVMDMETLEAFRSECSQHYSSIVSHIDDDEQDRSCSIDLFEDAAIEETHLCRLRVEDYLNMRWRKNRPTEQDCERIKEFLFRKGNTLQQQNIIAALL